MLKRCTASAGFFSQSGTINSNDDEDEDEIKTNNSCVVNMFSFIERAEDLLKKTGLMPKVVRPGELALEGIKWGERLSGGEKQKIGIIRALLENLLAKDYFLFILMDEATSALDVKNKRIVYEVVKKHVANLENYIIIYTDHSDEATGSFADATLDIIGQSIVYH